MTKCSSVTAVIPEQGCLKTQGRNSPAISFLSWLLGQKHEIVTFSRKWRLRMPKVAGMQP
jgi:hypothetical protein